MAASGCRSRPLARTGQQRPRSGSHTCPDGDVHGRRSDRRRADGQPCPARGRRPHALRLGLDRRRSVRDLARQAACDPHAELWLQASRDSGGAVQRRHPSRDLDLDLHRGDRSLRRPTGGARRLDARDRRRRRRDQRRRRSDPRSGRPRKSEPPSRAPSRDRRPARISRGDRRGDHHPDDRMGLCGSADQRLGRRSRRHELLGRAT